MRIIISPLKLPFLIGLLSLFVCSFSALGVLGFSAGDEGAGLLARMHPAFYLLSPVLAWGFLRRLFPKSGSALFRHTPPHHTLRASYIFYVTAVLSALMLSLVGLTHGSIMNTATTFLLPILCILGIARLNQSELRTVRNFLIIFMLANSLIGIFEKTFDYRIFAYTIGTEEKLNDPRPTAWFSHPLNNAVLTAIFLVYLIYSPTTKRLAFFRLPMIITHIYALTCFGGRTAVVALGLVLVAEYLSTFFRAVVLNRGVVRLWLQTALLMAAVVVILLAASYGVFDDLLDRFRDDGGSADVRWDSFALIRNLDLSTLLWGYGNAKFDSSLSHYGIRTIEFSWLYLLLKHGLLVGGALIASMCALLYGVSRSVGKPVGYMTTLLILVTFGYTSLASASLLLSQFFIMVAALQQTNYRASLV